MSEPATESQVKGRRTNGKDAKVTAKWRQTAGHERGLSILVIALMAANKNIKPGNGAPSLCSIYQHWKTSVT